MSPGYARFLQCIQAQIPVALVTRLAETHAHHHLAVDAEGSTTGSLGHASLDQEAGRLAAESLASGESRHVQLDFDGTPCTLFVDVQWPRHHLIVVGAVHIAMSLVTLAHTLGFYTTVIDSRSAFATPERFAHADELKCEWPEDTLQTMSLGPSTYLVFLSHDEKIDYPALQFALGSDVAYIGALGSRKTHAKRCQFLVEQGIKPAALDRIHAPIGLDIDAKTPEEIALAVLAEIVSIKNGKRKQQLM